MPNFTENQPEEMLYKIGELYENYLKEIPSMRTPVTDWVIEALQKGDDILGVDARTAEIIEKNEMTEKDFHEIYERGGTAVSADDISTLLSAGTKFTVTLHSNNEHEPIHNKSEHLKGFAKIRAFFKERTDAIAKRITNNVTNNKKEPYEFAESLFKQVIEYSTTTEVTQNSTSLKTEETKVRGWDFDKFSNGYIDRDRLISKDGRYFMEKKTHDDGSVTLEGFLPDKSLSRYVATKIKATKIKDAADLQDNSKGSAFCIDDLDKAVRAVKVKYDFASSHESKSLNIPLDKEQKFQLFSKHMVEIGKEILAISEDKRISIDEAGDIWLKKFGDGSEAIANTVDNVDTLLITMGYDKFKDRMEKSTAEIEIEDLNSLYASKTGQGYYVDYQDNKKTQNFSVVIPHVYSDKDNPSVKYDTVHRLDYVLVQEAGKDDNGIYHEAIYDIRVARKDSTYDNVKTPIQKHLDETNEMVRIKEAFKKSLCSDVTNDGLPIEGIVKGVSASQLKLVSLKIMQGDITLAAIRKTDVQKVWNETEQKYKWEAVIPEMSLQAIVSETEQNRDRIADFVMEVDHTQSSELEMQGITREVQIRTLQIGDIIIDVNNYEMGLDKEGNTVSTYKVSVSYKGDGELEKLLLENFQTEDISELQSILYDIESGDRKIIPNEKTQKLLEISSDSLSYQNLKSSLEGINAEKTTAADKVAEALVRIIDVKEQRGEAVPSVELIYPAGVVPVTAEQIEIRLENDKTVSYDNFIPLKDGEHFVELSKVRDSEAREYIVSTGELPAPVGMVYEDQSKIDPITERPVRIELHTIDLRPLSEEELKSLPEAEFDHYLEVKQNLSAKVSQLSSEIQIGYDSGDISENKEAYGIKGRTYSDTVHEPVTQMVQDIKDGKYTIRDFTNSLKQKIDERNVEKEQLASALYAALDVSAPTYEVEVKKEDFSKDDIVVPVIEDDKFDKSEYRNFDRYSDR